MLPEQIFSWENLFTLKGFIMIVIGGFLIGFGSRYAGGCTSGHPFQVCLIYNGHHLLRLVVSS
jgi:uncharacterized membrane protein YedE/YeeE